MRRVTYSPFSPLKPLNFNDLFDQFAGKSTAEFLGNDFVSATPSVNIIERDDTYDIEIAAPGLTKEDFTIALEKDQLIVSGSKKEVEQSEDKGKYSRREFNFKEFKRSFHISEDIDSEKIDARYSNGILTIELGKQVEVKDPVKTIEIA